MTEQDVTKVLAYAASCGREIGRDDAQYFLRAKELLAADPNHVAALSLLQSTMKFLETGDDSTMNFYKFTLGSCETDEEIAKHKSWYHHGEWFPCPHTKNGQLPNPA